jgi:hypothetical protein
MLMKGSIRQRGRTRSRIANPIAISARAGRQTHNNSLRNTSRPRAEKNAAPIGDWTRWKEKPFIVEWRKESNAQTAVGKRIQHAVRRGRDE